MAHGLDLTKAWVFRKFSSNQIIGPFEGEAWLSASGRSGQRLWSTGHGCCQGTRSRGNLLDASTLFLRERGHFPAELNLFTRWTSMRVLSVTGWFARRFLPVGTRVKSQKGFQQIWFSLWINPINENDDRHQQSSMLACLHVSTSPLIQWVKGTKLSWQRRENASLSKMWIHTYRRRR